MIYIPKRAVFIHIPRTGGNSITHAICTACVGKNIDVFLGTGSHRYVAWALSARHTRAASLRNIIEEWDNIYKFAVFRNEEDRLNSAKNLIQRDIKDKVYLDPTCTDGWRDLLISEELQKKFLKRWKPNDFYVLGYNGEDLGVEIYNFENLSDRWHEICDKCRIPRCELPKLNSS
jgi:hypothetical protein